jgi:hypothetical protein
MNLKKRKKYLRKEVENQERMMSYRTMENECFSKYLLGPNATEKYER